MKKLIFGMLVCTLLIAAAVLPVVGTMNNNKIQEEESTIESDGSRDSNPIIPDSNPKPRPIPRVLPPWLMTIFNNDWNYWSNSPDMYAIPTGNVGIGTVNPGYKLHVVDDPAYDYALYVENTYWEPYYSDVGYGIKSVSYGTAIEGESYEETGVIGMGRTGVKGISTSGGTGVSGESFSDWGWGVSGSAYGIHTRGVYGYASGDNAKGIYGTAWGVNSKGIHAYSSTGTALYAQSNNGIALEVDGTSNFNSVANMNDVLHLEPMSSFPSFPIDGDLCVQGINGSRHIYCYLNSAWCQLD